MAFQTKYFKYNLKMWLLPEAKIKFIVALLKAQLKLDKFSPSIYTITKIFSGKGNYPKTYYSVSIGSPQLTV